MTLEIESHFKQEECLLDNQRQIVRGETGTLAPPLPLPHSVLCTKNLMTRKSENQMKSNKSLIEAFHDLCISQFTLRCLLQEQSIIRVNAEQFLKICLSVLVQGPKKDSIGVSWETKIGQNGSTSFQGRRNMVFYTQTICGIGQYCKVLINKAV